ncbi:hypothetical protein F2P81_001337 [Scophthalmus maximus]|uniref:Uncharacterized protein n=1 Tax=Scophthalmus maximus TaxID=52904 RepID=A0A6A4TX20_SCOMX|nr:hypothetical protein F2P81_001337 [Scophthalmus maximus]
MEYDACSTVWLRLQIDPSRWYLVFVRVMGVFCRDACSAVWLRLQIDVLDANGNTSNMSEHLHCHNPASLSGSRTAEQAVDWLSIHQTRPLSSASWALAPPNSLRYQNIKQPVLSNLFHNASQSQRGGYYEEDWEESLSVCVLVPQGESDGLHTLLEIPLFGHNKLREILALGAYKSSEFSFPLTIVDGSREDDILMDSFKRNDADAVKREHGCFRSLFEAEKCPAPFMYGSQFYCFHCPGTEPVPGSRLKSRGQGTGLDSKAVELPLLHPTTLCGLTDRAEGGDTEGDNEGEEQLAVINYTLLYRAIIRELVGPCEVMAAPQRTTVAEAVGIGGRRNTQPTHCSAAVPPLFRIQWKSGVIIVRKAEVTQL